MKNRIFSGPTIIAYVSRFFELEPGDVIATGMPAGVGLGFSGIFTPHLAGRNSNLEASSQLHSSPTRFCSKVRPW